MRPDYSISGISSWPVDRPIILSGRATERSRGRNVEIASSRLRGEVPPTAYCRQERGTLACRSVFGSVGITEKESAISH